MFCMCGIHIYAISNDRFFSSGLRALLDCCEALAVKSVTLTELPFGKATFESDLQQKLSNKGHNFLILDCSCGFINYYNACSTLYSALAQGTLNAKVVLFYENNLCLTHPDMYNHFVTLDKNTNVDNILQLISLLCSPQVQDQPQTGRTTKRVKINQYLTGRELSVINEIYRGTSPDEIAKKLKLRIKTINSYKNKAMKKINSKRTLNFHPI